MYKPCTGELGKYQKLIQPHIGYCVTCQPYDEGDVVWVFGDRADLEELFDEYEVPEDLCDELAANLYFQNCGRDLCRYDNIGGYTVSAVAYLTRIQDIGWGQYE